MFAKESKDASTHILKVKLADLSFCNLKCSLTYQFLAEVAYQLMRWASKIAQKVIFVFSLTPKTRSPTIHLFTRLIAAKAKRSVLICFALIFTPKLKKEI